MRRNAYWMKQQDDRILELLDGEGWATPSLIASEASIDISKGHVSDRLARLQFAGLIAPLWNDSYEITMDGILYLRGSLDASSLPEPSNRRLSWG